MTDLQGELAAVTQENESLAQDAIAAQDAAAATQSQLTACQAAATVAGQIIANRDADLEFVYSTTLPEDPNDPVYAEAFARDQAYRELVGQFQASVTTCLEGTVGVAPTNR